MSIIYFVLAKVLHWELVEKWLKNIIERWEKLRYTI